MAGTNNVAQTSIDITQLASSIEAKLRDQSPSFPTTCIFKVPETLRQGNEAVFDPTILSVGPYHHRTTDRLAAMEEIKLWYLHGLVARIPIPSMEKPLLERFVGKIKELHSSAHDCYAEPNNLEEKKFIEMMVIDGCFLIELFRKHAGIVPKHNDDPIFSRPWMLETFHQDLILLENQIPWFVLQHLFDLTKSNAEQEAHFLHNNLVLNFFRGMMLTTEQAVYNRPSNIQGQQIKHILDLLRSCLVASSSGNAIPETTKKEVISPVRSLLAAEVRFRRGNTDGILNINFDNGVFKIPPIAIQKNSHSLLQNLISFEQCDRNCTTLFTSYAVLFTYLIKCNEDADVLCNRGIIEDALGSEDVYHIFKSLPNNASMLNFYYGGVARKVNDYCSSPWVRYRTLLRRDYFNSPQVIINWEVTFVTLFLTMTQTVLAVYAFRK